MKKILLLSAAVIMAFTAAAREADEPSHIQVNGHAEMEVTPDLFYLIITIDEKDSKGKLSVEQQQRDMIATLKRLGVDTDSQLKVANIESSFYKRSSSLSTARYQLELHSAPQVAKVISSLGDNGISNVSIQRVTHSKIEQYKNDVRVAAIRNARDVAVSLAEAIDQKCGRCFYIYDSNRSVTPFYNNAVMTRGLASFAAVAEDAAVEWSDQPDFKSIKLEYDVQARFELL